jgi:hypothetical protein
VNDGELDVIVMSERVDDYGHTMIGASHMILLGSLYQWSSEKQAIGGLLFNCPRLTVARMCRQGQLAKVIEAYILAEDAFTGLCGYINEELRMERGVDRDDAPYAKQDWWVSGHVD